jgi:hypothetical protein
MDLPLADAEVAVSADACLFPVVHCARRAPLGGMDPFLMLQCSLFTTPAFQRPLMSGVHGNDAAHVGSWLSPNAGRPKGIPRGRNGAADGWRSGAPHRSPRSLCPYSARTPPSRVSSLALPMAFIMATLARNTPKGGVIFRCA